MLLLLLFSLSRPLLSLLRSLLRLSPFLFSLLLLLFLLVPYLLLLVLLPLRFHPALFLFNLLYFSTSFSSFTSSRPLLLPPFPPFILLTLSTTLFFLPWSSRFHDCLLCTCCPDCDWFTACLAIGYFFFCFIYVLRKDF